MPRNDERVDDGVDTNRDEQRLRQTRASRQKDRDEFQQLQAEFREWASAPDSPLARSKRAELAMKIRKYDLDSLYGPEEMVDVFVEADSTGFNFIINDREYAAGQYHRVTATVAQTLLHMMSANREAERRILQNNGRQVNLGNIGDLARAAEIGRE